MRKGNCTVFFEIEPTHKNFPTLLDISKELDYDADYCLELELEVEFNWHYDAGRSYGEPENCYPAEFDFEIEKILCNSIDIIDLLDDNEIDKIAQESQESLEL